MVNLRPYAIELLNGKKRKNVNLKLSSYSLGATKVENRDVTRLLEESFLKESDKTE